MTRIVGVIDEDPFHYQTWSGSSKYFFEAFKQHDALVSAMAAEPSALARRYCQLMAVNPNIKKWKFGYHLSTRLFDQMSRVARNKLSSIKEHYDVILQVGAWYDLVEESKINVSYHDGNLAAKLASPFGYPNISKHVINKALEYERSLYHKLDLIFPMSAWLADSFVRDFGVNPNKVIPVGAGINLPKIIDTTGRCYDGKTLLMVGKDFERKGGKVLLEAFKLVRRTIPDARLKLIGPDINDIPKGVECLGFLSKNHPSDLDQILNEYKNTSVFVIPSLYEPFGISFVEAMAHRVPCVGTNICAMTEIIQDGVTGFVVPPNDVNALSEKLIELLSSEQQCRQFGNAGYQHYLDNYTWEKVTQKIIASIESF